MGFANQNTQCFAICAVQLLFGVPQFLAQLLQLASSADALQRCSAVVQPLAKLAAAANLRKNHHRAMQKFLQAALYNDQSWLGDGEYSDGEHDCSEFLQHLLEHLRDEPQFHVAFNVNQFEQLMRYRLGTAVHCARCGQTTERFRGESEGERFCLDFSATQLDAPLLATSLSKLTATYSDRDKCGHCSHTGLKDKHAIFQSPPRVLLLHIERWIRGKKCRNPLAVPAELRIDLFGKDYRLLAAAAHHGRSVRFGHWTALITRSGQWFSASDSTVQPANLAHTLASDDFQANVALVLLELQPAADERKG